MRKLKKLKLHELRKNELEKSSLKKLTGGGFGYLDSENEIMVDVVYCDCSADIYATVSIEKK